MLSIDSLVINRAIRGTLFDKETGEVIFTIDQIKDPSLECTGETAEVVDALGMKIAEFDRSKDATLSGSNALVNLGLAAAQFGSDKVVASSSAKITVPCTEVLTKASGKITLAHTPKEGSVPFIYGVNADSSLNATYKLGESASATEFAISGAEITVPTGTGVGDTFWVAYEYEAAEAISFANKGDVFAKSGRFVLEVLLADICNQAKEYYAYIVFGSAKMSNEVTINFSNEAEHGFEIKAIQDYCSTGKKLFEIFIADGDADPVVTD